MPDDRFDLAIGSLTPGQAALLLGVLPLDLTFIDEDDIIRYYSEDFRIFTRTPDIIGTSVLDCHTVSRDGVAQLLGEFRDGRRDSAEYLEKHDGRLVRVSYLAMRDAEGVYRGCLEVARYADAETALDAEDRLR